MTDLLALRALLMGLIIDLWNCLCHLCWVLFHALVARRASLRNILTGSVMSSVHLWRAYRKLRLIEEGPLVPGPVLGWVIDVYNTLGYFFEVLVGAIRARQVSFPRMLSGASRSAFYIYRYYRMTRRPARATAPVTH